MSIFHSYTTHRLLYTTKYHTSVDYIYTSRKTCSFHTWNKLINIERVHSRLKGVHMACATCTFLCMSLHNYYAKQSSCFVCKANVTVVPVTANLIDKFYY